MRRLTLSVPEVTGSDSSCRLAWARILCGMTQAQLGEALGLSPAWVSGVEHGSLIPTLQQKIRIAQILEMDVDDVFVEEEAED